MTSAFVAHVATCSRVNAWPFPNPPHSMTMAQLLYLNEAQRQLSGKAKPAGKGPRRLKGKSREAFYRAIGATVGEAHRTD